MRRFISHVFLFTVFIKNNFTGNIYFSKDCWKPNQKFLRKVELIHSPSALCLLLLPCPVSSVSGVAKCQTVVLPKHVEGFCSLLRRARDPDVKAVCGLAFGYSSRWKNLIYMVDPSAVTMEA